jgi:hypothetical protein
MTGSCTVGSVTQEGTVRTEFTHQDPGPSPHAYNDPDLSAIEFLHAVMRAQHQPMAIRIEAARALLPFTNPYPRPTNSVPRCTIVIGGLGPCDTTRAQGPATEATENRSENLLSANTTLTHDQSTQAPQNLTTIQRQRPRPLRQAPNTARRRTSGHASAPDTLARANRTVSAGRSV